MSRKLSIEDIQVALRPILGEVTVTLETDDVGEPEIYSVKEAGALVEKVDMTIETETHYGPNTFRETTGWQPFAIVDVPGNRDEPDDTDVEELAEATEDLGTAFANLAAAFAFDEVMGVLATLGHVTEVLESGIDASWKE